MGPTFELVLQTAHGIDARAYTDTLSSWVLALEEMDRLALPGRTARLDWAVTDLDRTPRGDFRINLQPRRLPARRPPGTWLIPGQTLVAGVEALDAKPDVPELFSPSLVARVQSVGAHLGRDGIDAMWIASMNGERGPGAEVTERVVHNAAEAVRPVEQAYSSVHGRLDTLSLRGRRGLRAAVVDDRTRRAVACTLGRLDGQVLQNAFGKRVILAGLLSRNASGQPLKLEVDELELLVDNQEPMSAHDLLGVDPNWTGDLTTSEYIDYVRRG